MDIKRCEYPYQFNLKEVWKQSLNNFCMDMVGKFERNVPLKGEPTKERLSDCPDKYLLDKLDEHLKLGHYEDVANFAFLLRQKHPCADSLAVTGGE
jgi:hypothetical protein